METTLLNKIIPCLEKSLPKTQKPVVAFDADGTLWPRDVGKSFFQYQVKNKLLTTKNPDPQSEFHRIQKEHSRKQALIWLAQVQAGFSLQELHQYIGDFLAKNPFKMFAFQQELIKWCLQNKVEVFVVSSSLKWVLDQALEPYHIPKKNIIGVQTQIQKGIITDKPILPAPIHTNKVSAFQAHIRGVRPFLSAGNTLADQALLEFSTQWRLVVATARFGEKNYDSERELIKIAIDRGWFYYDSLGSKQSASLKPAKALSKKASCGLKVFLLPVLQDNYIYILHDISTKKTAVVDPALAEPVETFLKQNKWSLDLILNTHHHPDHTGGNLKLKQKWQCPIAGFSKDTYRLPGVDWSLKEGEKGSFGSSLFQVLFLPGHTLWHIAYWFFEEKKLFIGDTLFAMGCGRLFEGTAEQMFHSLSQIKALPQDTKIFSAHEYTEKNGAFALSQDPENADLKVRMREVRAKRAKGQATQPFLLSEELKTNPFLRAKTVEEFRLLREKRDQF